MEHLPTKKATQEDMKRLGSDFHALYEEEIKSQLDSNELAQKHKNLNLEQQP